MITVSIDHPVHSFETWKATFDADPAGRARAGVVAYRISRALDEPLRLRIDLDFADEASARSFVTVLEGIWRGTRAQSLLAGRAQARLLGVIEHVAVVPV